MGPASALQLSEGLAAATSLSNNSISGISGSASSPGSCHGLSLASVVKKYKKAKGLLHAQATVAEGPAT